MSKQNKLLKEIEKLPVKVLAFDIDGTLYPNRKLYFLFFFVLLRQPRFQIAFKNVRKKIRKVDTEGKPFRKAQAELMAEELKITPEEAYIKLEEKLYSRMSKKYKILKPFKNLRNFLEEANAKGYKLYAMSDFPIGKKLESLGLEDLFEESFCTEDTGRLKPDIIPFKKLLEISKVEPHQIIYFGDSYEKDIVGASNAKMHTAHITRSKKSGPLAEIVYKNYK